MSEMLKEVLRWNCNVPSQRPADRWLGWAQSLNERYGHISQRHLGVGMTLTQSPALLYSSSQRWEQAAWNLFPQIKLAIHPILQHTLWNKVDRPGVVQRLTNLKPSEYSGSLEMNQVSVLHQQSVSNLQQDEYANSINQLTKRNEFSISWFAPLQRVFSRTKISHLEEELLTLGVHRKNLVVDKSEKIVRRVLDERQRVETRMTHQAMVIRHQPATSTIHSPMDSKVSEYGKSQSLVPQAIDVERLTDQVVRQIDQRIVAHRERLGRVF